ncbi:MAG: Crp/Fnr family transcriptional regulator [Roseiflexaceae bacterium]|nr:Crp/Fnr family transcriptional regulator [Roseiflexaceae bacterium]
MHIIERLHTFPCFSGLDTSQLGVLAENLTTQHFRRGEPIFHQGSAGSVFYMLLIGQVRVFTTSASGVELAVTMLRAGDFFGELALLDGQPRSASVAAMSPVTALLLQRSVFLAALNAHPPIAVALLEAMAARLRQSTSHADMLSSASAAQRVALQLLVLARHSSQQLGGRQIDLRLTQDDLASLAGTTRETVNRVLAALRDRGLIEIARARVTVVDVAQMETAISSM